MKKTRTANNDKKLVLSSQAIRLLQPNRLDEVAGGNCEGGTSGKTSISDKPAPAHI